MSEAGARTRLNPAQRLHVWLLYLLPHHLVSRLFFFCTRRRLPGTRAIIGWFVRHYGVNMDEAADSDPGAYATFNQFFTRALRPGTRHIAALADGLISPADSTVSALGPVQRGRLIQAKGIDYSLAALLGGQIDPQRFAQGSFATLYLSPRDYHRVHMPCAGTLRAMSYVPGRLFSVAPHTVDSVPGLFARNERVISLFDTALGELALILVGAINVAAIETVWSGLITPPAGGTTRYWHYHEDDRLSLAAGAEMGRFNMGSTVILVSAARIDWDAALACGTPLRLGQPLGKGVQA